MLKRNFLRAVGLIMVGGALFIAAPVGRVATVPLSAGSPSVSPTPVPTPEVKRPNPVRRFFSSIFGGIAGVFRRPNPPGCYLPLVVDSITSSRDVVKHCPPGTDAVAPDCSSDSDVMLTAYAQQPQDRELLFTWSVTAGRLRGEGRTVTWNLAGLPEGTYIATVAVSDGNIHTATGSIRVEVATCSDCIAQGTPCPTVSVSCPSGAESKLPVLFAATVAGGDPDVKPTYTWSITAGKIISGQGTSKIAVDASNLGGQAITATVTVGGFHPNCPGNIASCTVLELR